ncbi:MAG: transcriptional regulator [Actinophytocola sp.]|uniref:transcriptional regulator n=1 Tax=Actinophytocola sp. TaxID=1872138 RepID=UPI001326A250|nr:transcriptional regulator [Actinophytocola sp.]MPZ80879.1 transcriptional regulator [Actinophytocola sp.]
MVVASVGSCADTGGDGGDLIGEGTFIASGDWVGAAGVGVEEVEYVAAEQGVDDSQFVHEPAVRVGIVDRRDAVGARRGRGDLLVGHGGDQSSLVVAVTFCATLEITVSSACGQLNALDATWTRLATTYREVRGASLMRTFRTVLEQRIWERRQTLEEFVDYAENFAREHNEPGSLGVRHLQRLAAGRGPGGRPLGALRPATARLLERIFGVSVDELLASPPRSVVADVEDMASAPGVTSRPTSGHVARSRRVRATGDEALGERGADANEMRAMSFEWLDERAGWIPDTTRRKVASRVRKLARGDVFDRNIRRAHVTRSQLAHALLQYYNIDGEPGFGLYCAHVSGQQEIRTTILSRTEWLNLGCSLTPDVDRVGLADVEPANVVLDAFEARHAVNRLAEAVVLDVRLTGKPLYRLLDIDIGAGGISGHVGTAPFVEYALTMDLLEDELADALIENRDTRTGDLPLRGRYLPDVASVLDFPGRLCAGGVLGLCAIARPADAYRGPADYALLVQERSSQVVNAAGRLAVIPKGFHEPLNDVRADTLIGASLRREMEEELFGRVEVDSTADVHRAAAPMHPTRLSEPMRWLMDEPDRLRMECTGFGLNLISGNYEFASLIVIEDEGFWSRFGGDIEANWESAGLRLYSSLDSHLIAKLVADESWSNEGLFAFLQGLRRLQETGGRRVDLPAIELD